MNRIRVLIVDDSALMRELLTAILSEDPEIEVVGTAADPYQARDKIVQLTPDVLTLDVEMPRMNGLSFLEKLMHSHPMPVVMVSSLTETNCDTTVRAMELGAIDYVTKPRLDIRKGTLEHADEIVSKVKLASQARVHRRGPASAPPAATAAIDSRPLLLQTTQKVIAMGASTGGCEALVRVLTSLPADSPGVVIVQHMPQGFTRSFAARLDSLCRVNVKEAQDGDRVLAGHVLLAPGNFHMEIIASGTEYKARITQTDPVNRHRPSVDVLFHSCARSLGPNAAGVLLTGMGADGARGLLAMRQAGAYTIAQDEATSVVFGMPREAIALGAAEEVLPLDSIPAAMLRKWVTHDCAWTI